VFQGGYTPLDPYRTWREADRQHSRTVALVSSADVRFPKAIAPALAAAAGAFPNTLHAPGPRGYFDELTGPVAGRDRIVETDLNPPRGHTAKGTKVACEYPNTQEPHGRYYARPISIPWAEKWFSIGLPSVVLQSDIRAEVIFLQKATR